MENLLTLLEANNWKDYALLDSGDGLKLERFGNYVFSRPESQAMWKRALTSEWKNADAVFISTGGERRALGFQEEGGGEVGDGELDFSSPLPLPASGSLRGHVSRRERGDSLLGDDDAWSASWSLP
ncbi:MAG: hypothetical protein U0X87_04055 [Anaerolineales bacterium]